MDEQLLMYEHWLVNIHKSIGPVLRRRLRAVFGNAQAVYEADFQSLCKSQVLKEAQAYAIVSSKKTWDLYEFLLLKERHIILVTEAMECFPQSLKQLQGMPDVLYVKGELPKAEKKSVAIVGARQCTEVGRSFAERLGAELGAQGVQVISGMARGIDGYGHKGALSVGAKTFAVLGCGVDICYPREHIELYTQIQQCGGILSEYPPGTQGFASHFPARNRIISGLADVVVIIEARESGGALITAEFALEQGREVFAVPGRIGDRQSVGCNRLIQDGARLLLEPKEVLETLGIKHEQTVNLLDGKNFSLATEEELVYSCLGLSPVGLEELLEKTGLEPGKALSVLLGLELKGLVRELGKQYYSRV